MAVQLPTIKDLPNLLKEYIGDFHFVDYKCAYLTEPGENYGSLMLSVDVTLKNGVDETKVLRLVAKMVPLNEWIQRMFATKVTFKKEIYFYKNIVPTLVKFQREHKVPAERMYDMFPECINARINLTNADEVDDDAILLLENLKVQGFTLKDRLVGFDLDETVFVLRDLAKFHAVPLAYKMLHPNKFKECILPYINRVNIGQEMFETVSHKFIESTVCNLNLNEDELERFTKGMNTGFEFQSKFPPSSEEYSTFVHCDFWLNNTMLQYDEHRKPINNKIVDFQVVAYGSFAMDLVFFLFTSVIQSVLNDNFDYLITVYHSAFIDCLRDYHIDLKAFSLENFQNELQKFGPLEASHIIVMLRAVFASREKVEELTDFSMDDMFTQDGITDLYKKKLADTVRLLLDKKWI